MTWKKYKKLTEQQQTNWFLYNNINAHKTHSELDLINISLFKGRTYSAEYKEKKYSKDEWRKRAWWNQQLIFFDKRGWWNEITGWEKVGLLHVIEKKGPFFFKWKYQTKANRFKVANTVTIVLTDLLSNIYYLQAYNTVIKERYFKKASSKSSSKYLKYNIIKLKQKKLYLNIIDTVTYNRAIYKIAYLVYLTKLKLSLNVFINIYNNVYAYLQILPSLFSISQLSKILIYTTNIRQTTDFKYTLINTIFLQLLKHTWLRDNTHYLNTINFRISLLFQNHYQLNASLLASFYAQQLSILPARKTQRWFIRDTKVFNELFYVLSSNSKLAKFEFSTFQGIHFNTKGRISDTRRVFSKQHLYGYGSLPTSKHINHYKYIPMYAQQHLTTKWGSTNLRVVYFSNPYYHNLYWQQNMSQRQMQKYYWKHEFAYLFNSNFYNIDYQIVLKHKLYYNIWTLLNRFIIKKHITLKQWLQQNNEPAEKTVLNLKTANTFYKNNQQILFQQYFNIMWVHNQPIKQGKYIMENLFNDNIYYVRQSPLKYRKHTKVYLPNLQRTRHKWLKYLNKRFWQSIKLFKRKNITIDYRFYYKYKRQYFSYLHKRKWFLSNLFYPTIGLKLSKVPRKSFKY